jgi:hypothetical protein
MPVYANTDELKDRLGIPLNDPRENELIQAIDAASRWIEQKTGRRFYTVSETRYYTAHWMYPEWAGRGFGAYPWGNPERPSGGGRAAQHISIDDFVSVSAVATDDDGDGTYETAWTANSDYWLGPRNAVADGKPYRLLNRNQVTGRYLFPPWENGISVTGACGYSAQTPDQIRQLCMTVAALFARPLLEMSIPGVQSYKLANDLSITMDVQDLPPAEQSIIAQYRDGLFGV